MSMLESATAKYSEPKISETQIWSRCEGFDKKVAGKRIKFDACALVVESNGEFLFKLCGDNKCLSWNIADGEYSVGIEVAGIGVDIVAEISEVTVTGSSISFKLKVKTCFKVLKRLCYPVFEEIVSIAKLDTDFKADDKVLLAGTWVALTPQD